jgi:hypothetical protein
MWRLAFLPGAKLPADFGFPTLGVLVAFRGEFLENPREVIDYASRIDSKIALIDGELLWKLMIGFVIGVTKTATYEI